MGWYRSPDDLQRFQQAYNTHQGSEATFFHKLREEPEFCLSEFIKYLAWSEKNGRGHFHPPGVARDICYSTHAYLALRSRIQSFVRTMMDLDLVELSPTDHNDQTEYRSLTAAGREAIRTKSIYHLIFGPSYTLRRRRSALYLLTDAEAATGTAVRIAENTFITCFHCTRRQPVSLVNLSAPESPLPAITEQADTDLDLAILRVESDPGGVQVALSTSDPDVLDPVLVLHYPNIPALQTALIATTGEINGRSENRFRKSNEDLLISARTAPGTSGGAVLGRHGALVGIVHGSGSQIECTSDVPDAGTWRAEPFYHVIPLDQIRSFLASGP